MDYLNEVLNYPQYAQRTAEWEAIRSKILTATDIASILEYNEYSTKLEKYQQKTNASNEKITNAAIEHGTKYEKISNKLSGIKYNTKIYELGLKKHDRIDFLGASPDGVMLLDNIVTLIEYKCPLYRKISRQIPYMYWIQMQIQMEVWNVDQCIYSEYIYNEYNTYDDFTNDSSHIKGIIEEEKPIYWYVVDNWDQLVKRDYDWFKTVYHYILNFWQAIQETGKNKNKKSRSKSVNNIARINENIDFREIDWSKYINPYDITNYLLEDPILDWYNYQSHNNPDKYTRDKYPTFNFQNFIEGKTRVFKENIFRQLSLKDKSFINIAANDKLPHAPLNYQIRFHYPLKSVDNLNRTIDEMKKGTHIIANALLYNPDKHIYGKADLLVRKDQLSKLFKKPLDDNIKTWNPKKACNGTYEAYEASDETNKIIDDYQTTNINNKGKRLNTSRKSSKRRKIDGDCNDINDNGNTNKNNRKHYKKVIDNKYDVIEYVIVQVKYSTLNLMANGLHLLNNPKQKIYKGQCGLLIDALEYMHNIIYSDISFKCRSVYILGRKSKFTSQGYTYETDTIEYNIGIIDYNNRDSIYRDLYVYGQEWLQKLEDRDSSEPNKDNEDPNNNKDPDNNKNIDIGNIYPNMKNKRDFPWHTEKKILAHNTKDLSLILGLGPDKCAHLRNLGVTSWDKLSLVDLYTVKVTNPDLVWEIIQANLNNSIRNIEKLLTNKFLTKGSDIEIYIDFETISDLDDNINEYHGTGGMITMIGSYVKDNRAGAGYFINYSVNKLDKDSEKAMITAWLDEITDIVKESKKITLIHWSNAEYTHLKKILDRSPYHIKKDLNLIDLYDIFKKNQIAIPNAFSYGLKDIAGALNKLGKINTIWEDDIDGTQAMVAYWNANQLAQKKQCNIGEIGFINDIIKYNYIDCKTLEEITSFLRNELSNMCKSKNISKSKKY